MRALFFLGESLRAFPHFLVYLYGPGKNNILYMLLSLYGFAVCYVKRDECVKP